MNDEHKDFLTILETYDLFDKDHTEEVNRNSLEEFDAIKNERRFFNYANAKRWSKIRGMLLS